MRTRSSGNAVDPRQTSSRCQVLDCAFKLERKEKDSNCLEMTSRNRAKQIPLSAVLAGLKRLPIHVKRIGKYFAVDYWTRVTSACESGDQTVREIHAKNGLLHVRYAQRHTRAYTIKNVDAKPKTLILEQPAMNQYSLLSPAPVERTATAYRFEVKLPATGTEHLKVEQEQVTHNSTAVLSSTPDFLLTLISNKQLTTQGRQHLQAIADLKKRIAGTDAALDSTKAQINDLDGDQSRLGQNIDSLNRVRGQEDQVAKYSTQLSANETELAKLRDQTRDLALRKATLANDLRDLIDKLDF